MKQVADLAGLAALVSNLPDDLVFVRSTKDFWQYSAASTATHDGTAVVKPTIKRTTQAGRYLRVVLGGESAGAAALLAAMGGVTLLSGEADPSADTGIAADAPALYVRDNGEVWSKIGATDIDWSRLAFASELPAPE